MGWQTNFPHKALRFIKQSSLFIKVCAFRMQFSLNKILPVMRDWPKITKLIRHEINRCYAPTHLSQKKLQKETFCDIQLIEKRWLISFRIGNHSNKYIRIWYYINKKDNIKSFTFRKIKRCSVNILAFPGLISLCKCYFL